MRATALALMLALGTAGCGTARIGADGKPLPSRNVAKTILAIVAVGAAAAAAGAAVQSQRLEDDLRNDSKDGGLTGRQFANRDDEGQRWNRIARASAFIGGLSLLGLGVVWEMSLGDGAARGRMEAPAQPTGTPAAPPPAATR